MRLVEVTAPIIESGAISGYKKEDTAKYLWDEFVKHDIDVTYKHFIDTIPDGLKRKYSKSHPGDIHETHDFIKVANGTDGIIRKCVCGVYEIAGLVFKPEPPTTDSETEAREAAKTLTIDEERQVAQKSIIHLGLFSAKHFLHRSLELVKAIESKCNDPEILKDFEKALDFKEVMELCNKLEDLYDPQDAKVFYTKEEGEASLFNQMMDETNFRAPATLLQKAMCASLGVLTTFRQWAHKLSISPRQHQRVRQRLSEWPEKKPEIVIRNVLGSVSCPGCNMNLISKRKNPGPVTKTKFGNTKIDVPVKYQRKGLNPLEALYLEFHKKISPRKN
ncbi:MAG: hypothetical protein ACE5HI_01975 [bacterium]